MAVHPQQLSFTHIRSNLLDCKGHVEKDDSESDDNESGDTVITPLHLKLTHVLVVGGGRAYPKKRKSSKGKGAVMRDMSLHCNHCGTPPTVVLHT